jgi:hypothetical protein
MLAPTIRTEDETSGFAESTGTSLIETFASVFPAAFISGEIDGRSTRYRRISPSRGGGKKENEPSSFPVSAL